MSPGAIIITLIVAIAAYRLGRRNGFRRHACNWARPALPADDRAPAEYIVIQCACGVEVDLAIIIETDGAGAVSVNLDHTDLQAHWIDHP